jgi:REP element-mobilizing transposase RayT
MFFLRPSRRTNRIFRFCLAVAAARTGVLLHAFCVLSNHYHLVVTDLEGRLPEFMHWLNEYVAKCVNAELGRWESFWAPGSYSSVTLQDASDVMKALVYVYTNPTTAGLVRSLREWPGAHSVPEKILGEREEVGRPSGFFRENGPVPERAMLEIVPPAVCEREGLVAELISQVAQREAELRERFRKAGRRFLGRRRVLAQSPYSRPRSHAPRRNLNPRLAARDKWRRIESLQRLKGFLVAYREAWRRFTNGERSVQFPYGTYWMRVRFGVLCCGP